LGEREEMVEEARFLENDLENFWKRFGGGQGVPGYELGEELSYVFIDCFVELLPRLPAGRSQ